MKSVLKILIVEDSEDDALLNLHQIKKGGYEIYFERVETSETFTAALNSKDWDIILSDYTMPNFSGLNALLLFKEAGKEIPFIIISGAIGEEVAVDAMKAGANDYIMKNHLQRLLPAVERELRESQSRAEKKLLEQKQKQVEKSLKDSEERFRSLYENVKIGLYRTAPDGTILMANKALVKMLGYSSFNELAKRNLEQEGFEFNQQRKVFLEAIEKDGEVENYESTWIRKDSSPVLVRESSQAIRDTNGKTLFYDGIVEDITERKKIKEAHRINEKRLGEFNTLQGLLLQPNPLEKKLKLITEAVVKIMGADFARIWMIKPGDRCQTGCIHAQETEIEHSCKLRDRCLHLMVSSGRYSHTNGKFHARIPFGCNKIGEVAATDKNKLLTNKVLTDPYVQNKSWAKELRLVSFSGYRLIDTNGITLGVLALFSKQEITVEDDSFLEGIAHSTSQVLHAARAEAALLESETRYRSLFEASADGIQMVDNETMMLNYANPALCQMLGYSAEELSTLKVEDIHPKKDMQRIVTEFESVAHGEKVLAQDIPCLRKDGSIMFADINSTDIIIDDKPYKMGIFRDITERKRIDDELKKYRIHLEEHTEKLELEINERKRVEDELRNSEERMKILFDYAPDAYYLNDLKGNFIDGNIAAQKLLGFDKKDLIGKSFLKLNLISTNQIAKAAKLLAKNALGQSIGPEEFTLTRKDKSKVSVEIIAHPIKMKKQSLVLGIARDITERKKMEFRLKGRLKELKCLYGISKIIETPDLSLKEIFLRVVSLVPTSWQHSEIANCRVIIDKIEYKEPNFKKTDWVQSCKIKVNGKNVGTIEICYLEEMPKGDEGPFLKEERLLINSIAERLGHLIEHKQIEVAFRESNERYRLIFDMAPDGLFISNLRGITLEMNYATEKILGVKREDIIGKNFLKLGLLKKSQIPSVIKILKSGIFSKHQKSEVLTMVRKDGTEYFMELNLHFINYLGKKHMLGIARDITESKRFEDKLQETNARHSAMIENIGDVIAILGVDGITKYQSPNMEKWFGWKPEDLIGTNGWDKMHPEDIGRIQNEFSKMLKKETASIVEYRFICKDGHYKWIEMTAVNRINDPAIKGVLLNYHDITNRKKAEEALKQAHNNTKTILDNSPFGVMVLGKDRKIRWINKTAIKLAGVKNADVMIGKNCSEYLCTTDQDKCPILDKGQKVDNSERIFRRYDGKEIPIIKTVSEINFNNENVLLETFVDITERKQAEAALRESETRYRSLFEASADGIQMVDIETRMLKYANPALCKMLGYTVDELAKLRLEDIHPKKDMYWIIAKFESQISGNSTLASDIPCLRKDGSIVYADINSTQIKIENKPHNMGIFRDITERKKAQEALKLALESSQKKQDLLNAVAFSKQLAEGNVSGLVRQITLHSAKTLDIERVSVWFFNDTGNELRCEDLYENSKDLHTAGAVLLQNDYKNEFEAMRMSKYVDANDPLNDPRTAGYVDEYLKPLGITSMLDASIWEGNRNMGVLRFEYVGKTHIWESNEITFISQLANQIAFAVLNHERALSENLLKSREEHYRSLFENAPIGIGVSNFEGKIIAFNNAMLKPGGYSRDDFTKMGNMTNLYHNLLDRKRIISILKEKGFVNQHAVKLKRKDGSLYDTLLTLSIIHFKDQPRIQMLVEDITERKRSEEALRYERTLLRLLIDNVPDLMYTKDTACRKTLVNKADMKNMGVKSKSEVLGKDDFAFFSKDIAEKFYADDQSVIQTGQPMLNKEEYSLNEKGQKKWLLTSKIPLRDEHDQIIGLVGIGRDITQRKQAMEEIKVKNEQLLKVNAEKDKFFSIIAHDLRGPLGGLMGFTELLVNDLPDLTMDKIHKYVLMIRDSSANLFRFLENLLEWARQEQGLIPFKPKLIQLLPAVNNSLAIVMGAAKNKDIEINSEIPENLNVFADENMLQTVIRNLITNAVKFTPKHGKISLLAKKTDDKCVEIAIKDTGIGMDSKMVNKLFLISAKTNRVGTDGEPSSGLGLLLCKEFIEKHGGKIWVESKVKDLSAGIVGGTTMHFTINNQP